MTVVLVNILKTFFKCLQARSNLKTKASLLARSSGRGCGIKLSYANRVWSWTASWATEMFSYCPKKINHPSLKPLFLSRCRAGRFWDACCLLPKAPAAAPGPNPRSLLGLLWAPGDAAGRGQPLRAVISPVISISPSSYQNPNTSRFCCAAPGPPRSPAGAGGLGGRPGGAPLAAGPEEAMLPPGLGAQKMLGFLICAAQPRLFYL